MVLSSLISKTKKASAWFAALLMFTSLFSYAQTNTWQTIIYNKLSYSWGASVAMSIDNTKDSGLVMIKNEASSVSQTDNIMIKLNKFGNIIWSKNLGRFASGGPVNKVLEAHDTGYIYIGGYAGEIAKTDDLGNVKWAYSFGKEINRDVGFPGEFCQLNDIQKTNDGGYILTGMTSNFGNKAGGHPMTGIQDIDVYLVKVNSAFKIQWTKTYGTPIWIDLGKAIEQTLDGGFIISGQAEMPNVGQWVESAGFLLKTSSNGALQWAKTYGTLNPKYISSVSGVGEISGNFNSIIPTSDGGYLATGTTGAGWGAWVVKTDEIGNLQWTKVYEINKNAGCGGLGVKLYKMDDSEYILQAQSNGLFYNQSCGNNQAVFLLKLDNEGNIKWKKSFGNKQEYSGGWGWSKSGASCKTIDSGIAICSYVFDTIFQGYQNNNGFSHVYKLDVSDFDSNCHNSVLNTYTIPTVSVNTYSVTVSTGSIVIYNNIISSSFTITVIPNICFNFPITANFNQTNNCLADTAIFTNTSNGSIFNWNFGDPVSSSNNTSTLFEPKHKYSAVGNYSVTLTVYDGDGDNPSSFTKIITIHNCNQVWPGDADNNLAVNNYDLLPIGIYYGKTGPARNSFSNTWTGFDCNKWNIDQYNGKNLKYADCNGDSIINGDDTLAINLNFGLTHNKKENALKNNTNDPVLKLVSKDTTYAAGATVTVEVWAGDKLNTINNLYGVGFDISYNLTTVQAGVTNISYSSGFIGTLGNNVLKFSKIDEVNGKIYGAITRNNHTNTNGYGKIATLKFKTTTAINSLTNDLQLAITKYQANDSAGTALSFNVLNGVAIDKALGINNKINTLQEVNIYPNPNSGNFTVNIENVNSAVTISIMDITGRIILKQMSENNKNNFSQNIDLSALSKGIYFLKINTKDAIAFKKIVLE